MSCPLEIPFNCVKGPTQHAPKMLKTVKTQALNGTNNDVSLTQVYFDLFPSSFKALA